MSLPTNPYKGARDFYPEDKRIQKYMFDTMRRVVERYGYEEYDAPILEPLELYLAKTGEEIVNEQTYSFTDRGERQVVIRPEMTPTVSRMVAAKRQELAYPLRWYSIPNLWRYERPQRGRLREHWQLNVDIFGVDNLAAEHEAITVADGILQAFGAKQNMYSVKLNSRQLMDEVLQGYLQLDEVQAHSINKLIDRMHKMDYTDFAAQLDAILIPVQREDGVDTRLLDLLQIKSLHKLPDALRELESVKELERLLKLLADNGISNAVFDITMMRGFDYYTNIVFEVFDTHPENNRSMFGGGRYDGLVGLFGVEPVPTVGFGMGDVTLQNFLETHDLLPDLTPPTDAYVVLIGEVYEKSVPVLAKFRELGLNIAVDSSGRKAEKQLKTAIKKNIRYAIFIGESEIEDEQYSMKDLRTGQEEKHGIERMVSVIKDYRHENNTSDRD